MATSSAPHEHEAAVLLRNLESHLINAVQISRALSERFGLNVGDNLVLFPYAPFSLAFLLILYAGTWASSWPTAPTPPGTPV